QRRRKENRPATTILKVIAHRHPARAGESRDGRPHCGRVVLVQHTPREAENDPVGHKPAEPEKQCRALLHLRRPPRSHGRRPPKRQRKQPGDLSGHPGPCEPQRASNAIERRTASTVGISSVTAATSLAWRRSPGPSTRRSSPPGSPENPLEAV